MNAYYLRGYYYSSELYHHGIKGQKWGIRRYQNPDGTYTAAGKERYGATSDRQANRLAKYQEREYNRAKKDYERERVIDEAYRDRLKKKREAASYKGNDKKVSRLDIRINNYEDKMKAREKITNQVLKNIQDMKVSDMKRENRIRGMQRASDILITAGTLGMSSITGFYLISISNPNYYVQRNREKNVERELINKSKH